MARKKRGTKTTKGCTCKLGKDHRVHCYKKVATGKPGYTIRACKVPKNIQMPF